MPVTAASARMAAKVPDPISEEFSTDQTAFLIDLPLSALVTACALLFTSCWVRVRLVAPAQTSRTRLKEASVGGSAQVQFATLVGSSLRSRSWEIIPYFSSRVCADLDSDLSA